jgi:hypothetical protein
VSKPDFTVKKSDTPFVRQENMKVNGIKGLGKVTFDAVVSSLYNSSRTKNPTH